MISKINFTPATYFAKNSIYNSKTQNNSLNFKSGLKADTVTFSSKQPFDVINNAFAKLAKNRKVENGLGLYMGKTDKVNIYLQETKFGKEAKLSLTEGVFGDKSYASFNIKRILGKPVEITAIDNDMPANDAKKLVETYLQDIK